MSDARSPSRHYCDHADCGKSFRRAEHLNRHRLNHTNSTIPCPQCDRLFYRKDLLQRHLTLKHGKATRRTREVDPGTFAQHADLIYPNTYNRAAGRSPIRSTPTVRETEIPSQFPVTTLGPEVPANGATVDDVLSISDDIFPFSSSNLNLSQEWGWLHQYPLPALPAASESGAQVEDIRYRALGLTNDWVNSSSSQCLYISQEICNFLVSLGTSVEASHPITAQDAGLIMNRAFLFIMESLPIFYRPTFSFDPIQKKLCASIFCIGLLISPEQASYQTGCALLGQIRSELLQYVEQNTIDLTEMGILQAMLIVEFSGMYLADRAAMELSDIFHGILVTLSRRLDLFEMTYDDRRTTSAGADGIDGHTPIERESLKRLAYFVFALDIEHALLFGHERSILSVYSMKLELPSEEEGWQVQRQVVSNQQRDTTFRTRFHQLCQNLLSDPQGHISILPNSTPLSNFFLILGLSSVVLDLLRRQQDPFFNTKQALSRLASILPVIHGRLMADPEGPMKLHGRAVYHITAIALCTPLDDLERAANDGFSRTGRTPKQHTRAAIIRLLTKHKVGAESARHAVHLLKLYLSSFSDLEAPLDQSANSFTGGPNAFSPICYSRYEPSALYFGVLTLWAYIIGRVSYDDNDAAQLSEHSYPHDGTLPSSYVTNSAPPLPTPTIPLLQGMEAAINNNDSQACLVQWRIIVQHVTAVLALRRNCNSQEYSQVLGSLSDNLTI